MLGAGNRAVNKTETKMLKWIMNVILIKFANCSKNRERKLAKHFRCLSTILVIVCLFGVCECWCKDRRWVSGSSFLLLHVLDTRNRHRK